MSNGLEFILNKLECWCRENKNRMSFNLLGKPMHYPFLKRCSGSSEGSCSIPICSESYRKFEKKLMRPVTASCLLRSFTFGAPSDLLEGIVNKKSTLNGLKSEGELTAAF